MTTKLADRVKETTTTTGTGTINLDGAVSGFQTFVAGVGNGNACYYCIVGGSEWEVGIGTVTDASPDTLSRTTILASSNSGSAVSFSAGTKDVFCTAPAYAHTLAGAIQLGTVTLGSDNSTLASFTDVPSIYNDLRLSIVGRTDSGSTQNAGVRFNNDSGSNYTYQTMLNTDATTVVATYSQSMTFGLCTILGSASQNANGFCSAVADIPNYIGTSFQKSWIARGYTLYAGDGTNEGRLLVVGGRWKNTAAITRIDVVAATGNFKTGSYCTLYGIGRH